jgi:hypothetical protein
MTAKGIKTEDYRELTPYWYARLVIDPKLKFRKYTMLDLTHIDYRVFEDPDFFKSIKFKKFTANKVTMGYPSRANASKRLYLNHLGIEVRTGKPEWGAEPDKLYFVIKHGDIYNI